jgi:hypothetical protein
MNATRWLNPAISMTLLACAGILYQGETRATDSEKIPESNAKKSYCLDRGSPTLLPILTIIDDSTWQTCTAIKLQSGQHAATKCTPAPKYFQDVELHVRKSSAGQYLVTASRPTGSMFKEVPAQRGPNPLEPLWLRVEHGGYAYYLYLLALDPSAPYTKIYYAEAFNLSSGKDCLAEMPENPGVVKSCPDPNAEAKSAAPKNHERVDQQVGGAWLSILQNGVGIGPERKPTNLGICASVP